MVRCHTLSCSSLVSLVLLGVCTAQSVTATQLSCAPGINPLNVTFNAAGATIVSGTSNNPASTIYAILLAPLPAPLPLPPYPASCCGVGSVFYVPGALFVGPIVGPTPATPLFIPRPIYAGLLGSGIQVWVQAATSDPSGFSPCLHITDAKRITF